MTTHFRISGTLAAAALAATALLLSACSPTGATDPATTTGAAGGGDTLRVDIATPPASLDPAAVCSIEDLGLLSDVYPTLTQYAVEDDTAGTQQVLSSTEVEGNLAESWDVSDDGLTYTFTLRDAQFPSGNPITSEVVKWSWERAIALGSCGASFSKGGSASELVSIETPDEHTVVTTLGARNPDYLLALTSAGAAIVDQVAVEAAADTVEAQNQWLASNFAGGAAYVVDSYDPGNTLALSANPDWWGTAPSVTNVDVSFVSDDAALLLRARNGEADVTLGLTKQSVASLEETDTVSIIDHPAAAWQLIGLPNELAPFDNAKFREALTYATPQQDLVDQVAQGYGQAYYGPFSPAFAAYNEELSAPREYDIEKAKTLIEESGVTLPVKVDAYIRDGVNDQKQIATIIQDSWKQLGVELNVVELSAAEYQNAAGAEKKEWVIIRFDGPSVVTPSWLASYDIRCGQLYNQSNYCNQEVDTLITEAGDATTDEERQDYWDQVTELWTADSPRAIAYAQNFTAVLGAGVDNYVYGQNNIPFHLWSKN